VNNAEYQKAIPLLEASLDIKDRAQVKEYLENVRKAAKQQAARQAA